MTDDRTARPLSGEIMPGVPRETERRTAERRLGERRAVPDVVDADFVTVGPGTPVWSATAAPERPHQPDQPRNEFHPDIDILKGRNRAEGGDESARRRAGPLFWIFGLCLVLAAFWVSGGHALVSRAPPGLPHASLQRTPQTTLRITGVTSRIERSRDRLFLLVDGEVANEGADRTVLPDLEIRVAGKDGRTTLYFLGTSARRLEPGERFAFSSRLEAPKDGIETVTVDFRKEG